jgi:hypothetical protein
MRRAARKIPGRAITFATAAKGAERFFWSIASMTDRASTNFAAAASKTAS